MPGREQGRDATRRGGRTPARETAPAVPERVAAASADQPPGEPSRMEPSRPETRAPESAPRVAASGRLRRQDVAAAESASEGASRTRASSSSAPAVAGSGSPTRAETRVSRSPDPLTGSSPQPSSPDAGRPRQEASTVASSVQAPPGPARAVPSRSASGMPPEPATVLAPPVSPLPAEARQLTLHIVLTTLSCSAHAPSTPNASRASRAAFMLALCPPEATPDRENEKRTASLVSDSQ